MDSWGENLHYTQEENGEYKCPACGEAAYYDSDYGQQLFVLPVVRSRYKDGG